MARYQDRSVLVIGGTHGMGFATAKAVAEGGARVLATGANPSRVREAQRELGEHGAVVCSDVASQQDREALAAAVTERLGLLDAVFVFAAVAEFAPFDQVTEDSFDHQFAVNTRGVFFAMQRIAPLIRDGGSITATTVTPATASPAMGVYMATKAAVRAFSQVLAAELLTRRIRVNCLAPGFVDTPTLGVTSLSAEERRELAQIGDLATPMKRHGTVQEIARAALFLGFDATFTTGVELPVDGGISTVDTPQPAVSVL